MPLVPGPDDAATPLYPIASNDLAGWIGTQSPTVQAWVEANRFGASLGDVLVLPGDAGAVAGVLVGWGTAQSRARGRFHLAAAMGRLPAGRYAVQAGEAFDAETEALGWLLGDYRFERYHAGAAAPRLELVCPEGVDAGRLETLAAAATLCQDLINMPANDFGPAALERAFLELADRHGAQARVITGAALLDENFPMIHAVGVAASEPPRLLDMVWGRVGAPLVTIVGKGVCFDTGGLDIKPSASMGLMKKDLGGAATGLGLASMVMGLGLDLRLRLLVPAVENAISAAAMRPGDILRSRKGLSVEVNNTDAEGRLVLADALALADEEAPELLISLATLTGAARVALGPDVPAFFTGDDGLAAALAGAAGAVADPLWRLPFWDPYEPLIEPGIADLDNAPTGGMAGAITAALFLRRFVEQAGAYLHVDLYGWTPTAKPGRPKGGAFQAARAILAVLEARYAA